MFWVYSNLEMMLRLILLSNVEHPASLEGMRTYTAP